MCKYVQRTGHSNNLFTNGKVYKLLNCDQVENNKGGVSNICVSDKINATNKYWKYVDIEEYSPVNDNEGNKMSKLVIEETILINGKKHIEYSKEDLIQLIQKEEIKIESLKAVKAKSKAIETLSSEHAGNIEKLVNILDSM